MDSEPGTSGRLVVDRHARYICTFAKAVDTLEFYLTEHFRLSGVYWGVTALALLGHLHNLDGEGIVKWVLSCQNADGGFGGSPRHDSHILYTLSAVQILVLYDKLELVDADQVASYISKLQQSNGSFIGDSWGEVDTRFSYVALCCCWLLDRLDRLNVRKAAQYVASCRNFDGGFGCTPGNESHAGQVFVCVAALHIADSLDLLDADLLCWLSERQTAGGGLNGRPEKLPDVCYSWWCLSALSILGRLHWIDQTALQDFILSCQDEDDGGISDRPEDMVDVFHTFFGIAGLCLMGHPGLKAVDPTFALPLEDGFAANFLNENE
ncbi:hypothetical protein WJX73_010430 [Symbiochloris irregularis]|uniref:Geranylgeranyl transferase type-2 subunit beta n=1 Tax=Symbiochloris irregularis TaxID=706552 RepID=A0AAW1PWN6_9CHLO